MRRQVPHYSPHRGGLCKPLREAADNYPDQQGEVQDLEAFVGSCPAWWGLACR
jgi:hypothetical protein